MNKKITILTIGILIFFGMLFFIQPTNAYLDFEIYTASSTAEEFGWVGAGDITNLEQYAGVNSMRATSTIYWQQPFGVDGINDTMYMKMETSGGDRFWLTDSSDDNILYFIFEDSAIHIVKSYDPEIYDNSFEVTGYKNDWASIELTLHFSTCTYDLEINDTFATTSLPMLNGETDCDSTYRQYFQSTIERPLHLDGTDSYVVKVIDLEPVSGNVSITILGDLDYEPVQQCIIGDTCIFLVWLQ